MRTELRVLTPHEMPPCAKPSGSLATIADLDKRRRTSEAKLAACDAQRAATNEEIKRLKSLGAK